MDRVRHLIVGAGISGLATAAFLESDDYLVLEADTEIGGYCKTIVRDGFVWDYSGHFFHFRDPDLERFLLDRMGEQRVLRIRKESKIRFGEVLVDYPFQKNIHQLPREDFLECLVDLFSRDPKPAANFREMLYAKFGRGIAEKFLVPYNEKLYATDLSTLDVDAMGRFFPHANVEEIVRNFRNPENETYNATFTYPEGGAIQYVHAIASEVDSARIALSEPVVRIDPRRKVAVTPKREIAYEHLVSSAPFPRLLALTGLPHDPSLYSSNKVEVWNLGFDRKGPTDLHWLYFPDPSIRFYRVGFYDNIFGSDRMSLYVEIGRRDDEIVDETTEEATLARVLDDLARVGIVEGHRLVARHHVVMDPAYVHITRASQADVARQKAILETASIHSIGRYGSWTYCSIEDNLIEARALAERFNALDRAGA
ncbi:MAG: NAD(P)-binding protein [Polyangiales bacterium]